MSLLDNVDINNMNNGSSCQPTFLTGDPLQDCVSTHAQAATKHHQFYGNITAHSHQSQHILQLSAEYKPFQSRERERGREGERERGRGQKL